MNIFVGILVCVAATIFVILGWEMIRYCIADLYLRKQSIRDVKENIISCLDEADGLGYEIMFRTPECVAYKDCKLHVATTENGKEVIMIDLI
jgi:hypothetical protein